MFLSRRAMRSGEWVTRGGHHATDAGHVIIALSRGLKVHSATVVPSPADNAAGYVHYDRPLTDLAPEKLRLQEHRKAVEATIAIFLAGKIAKQRHNLDSWGDVLKDFSEDYAKAILISDTAYADSCHTIAEHKSFAQIEKLVRDEIAGSWDKVRRVADALIERKTLNEAEILAAYEGNTTSGIR
jgi:hypothetical protein